MQPVLEAKGIVKRFDSLMANDHIDFEAREGELHALLGENGAGKSTLLNVLYGVLKPNEGEIFVKGKKAKIGSTRDAIVKYKIGKVSQFSDLVPTFTVAENVLFRDIPRKYGWFIDRSAMRRRVHDLLAITGHKLDPDAVVENLSVGEQQNVELLKILYQDADIIFLDESSALLAPQEVKDLFGLLRELAKKGRTIILVTHKLDEALLCDRITVLRNGRVSLKAERGDINQEELLKAMFGEKIDVSGRSFPRSDRMTKPILEVRGLCTGERKHRNDLENVSLAVCPGEIVGIAGIAGNGQEQLLDTITGFLQPRKGQIVVNGEDITQRASPHFFRKRNMFAYVPEDHRGLGSFLNLTVADNLILGEGRKPLFFPRAIRNRSFIQDFSTRLINEYDVRTTGIDALADSLSGGNLQKMIVAREFSIDTDLIIVANLSQGLDFKTTDFVHAKLLSMKTQGKGILLVSKDLDEVIKLSDRIGVMYEGKLSMIPREEANLESIGRIMVGLDANPKRAKAN